MTAGLTCLRCGAPLATSYRTLLVGATEHLLETAPDGTSMSQVLAATSACSWNCLAVLAAQLAGPDADAAVQVVAERERQVTAEGYSPEHDDTHPNGDLAAAGCCYVAHGAMGLPYDSPMAVEAPTEGALPPDVRIEHNDRGVNLVRWPWDAEWWKPKDPERDLVRGAALVAAEADRLVRARRLAAERF